MLQLAEMRTDAVTVDELSRLFGQVAYIVMAYIVVAYMLMVYIIMTHYILWPI